MLGTHQPECSCPAYGGQALSSSRRALQKQQGKYFGSLVMAIKYLDGLPPPCYPSVLMIDSSNALPLAVSGSFSK